MNKTNVKADPSVCAECYSCQLICSLIYTGAFNPLLARIVIQPGEISFRDECVETCSLCTNYCAYGALTRQEPDVPRIETLRGKEGGQ